MNGPEHYLAAERLADQANHFTYGDGGDPVTGAALAAEAQVHATLALAAATALTGYVNPEATVTPDELAWDKVAGVHRDEPTRPDRSGPAPDEDETPWADRIGQHVTVTDKEGTITGRLTGVTVDMVTVWTEQGSTGVPFVNVIDIVPAPPARGRPMNPENLVAAACRNCGQQIGRDMPGDRWRHPDDDSYYCCGGEQSAEPELDPTSYAIPPAAGGEQG